MVRMPRPTNMREAVPGVDGLLRAVRDKASNIRDKYREDPLALAEHLGLKLPEKPVIIMLRLGVITPKEARRRFGRIKPGLRDLIHDVCTLTVRSAVVVANRGGGKSLGVAFTETFLTFVLDFDAINLGGSELQADAVYSYIEGFVEGTPEFNDLVKGEMLRSETNTTRGAWIRVLTASSKSVRSPHAGGLRRIPGTNPPQYREAGGILVIDEEAEAAPEIVNAALSTVNTALPSVNVRASTFHNVEGTFAEVVDNADEMGFKVYQWDIFDVCAGCDCPPDKCESEEKCFREDHYERFIDPDTGKPVKRLLHRAYCGGRARYAEGWIPLVEIETLWKRMKRNHSTWEVEAMGMRPSSSGYVIKDRKAYTDNVTSEPASELYMPGWPVTVCIDWGATAAGLTVWQEQPADRHVLLHADLVTEAGVSQIIGSILGYQQQYSGEFQEVAADIGGGGNYLNPMLREEYGVECRDVNFAQEKESAVAAWNILNESNSITYPEEFEEFHDQVKKWKRKNGRIDKGNDHLCDSSICYFAKFVERLGVSNIRVPPRTFSASTSSGKSTSGAPDMHGGLSLGMRVPLLRSFGRKR